MKGLTRRLRHLDAGAVCAGFVEPGAGVGVYGTGGVAASGASGAVVGGQTAGHSSSETTAGVDEVMTIARSSKRKVLGVSLGDRAAAVAEVFWTGVGARVLRAADFPYPAGLTTDDPPTLGAALGAFMRERGFTARQAVNGLPAKWLICRGQTLPPADAETAAAMLRLRGEAESAAELGEMVFDFAGESSEAAPSNVLLVGVPRRRLDAVRAVATAAGLNVSTVTACAVALTGALAAAGRAGAGVMLSVRADGAELAAHDGGHVRFLRHLGSAGAGMLAELRRAAAVLPAAQASAVDTHVPIGAAGRELVIFDDTAMDAGTLESVGAAVGLPVVRADVTSLGAGEEPAGTGARVSAVALAGVAGRRAAVDFLHPRIVAPVKRNLSRRVLWTSTGAAAVVLVSAVAFADLTRLERQVAETNKSLQELDPAYRLAKPFVADMQFARSFSAAKPQYLACLRDVTQAMPEGGQAYLTGFNLHANMQGELIGRAASSQDVLNLQKSSTPPGASRGSDASWTPAGRATKSPFS
jgi:hypothetical protein